MKLRLKYIKDRVTNFKNMLVNDDTPDAPVAATIETKVMTEYDDEDWGDAIVIMRAFIEDVDITDPVVEEVKESVDPGSKINLSEDEEEHAIVQASPSRKLKKSGFAYESKKSQKMINDYKYFDMSPSQSVVKSEQTKTVNSKLVSSMFKNDWFKLAACPTKRSKCGNRVVHLDSYKSQPVELKISNFTEKDQCTWLIASKCGLPSIAVTDITQGINGKLLAGFIEFEANTYDHTKFESDNMKLAQD